MINTDDIPENTRSFSDAELAQLADELPPADEFSEPDACDVAESTPATHTSSSENKSNKKSVQIITDNKSAQDLDPYLSNLKSGNDPFSTENKSAKSKHTISENKSEFHSDAKSDFNSLVSEYKSATKPSMPDNKSDKDLSAAVSEIKSVKKTLPNTDDKPAINLAASEINSAPSSAFVSDLESDIKSGNNSEEKTAGADNKSVKKGWFTTDNNSAKTREDYRLKLNQKKQRKARSRCWNKFSNMKRTRKIAEMISAAAGASMLVHVLHLPLLNLLVTLMWRIGLIGLVAGYGMLYFVFCDANQKTYFNNKTKENYPNLFGGDLTAQYNYFDDLSYAGLIAIVAILLMNGFLDNNEIGSGVVELGLMITAYLFWQIRRNIKKNRNPIKLVNALFDSAYGFTHETKIIYLISAGVFTYLAIKSIIPYDFGIKDFFGMF